MWKDLSSLGGWSLIPSGQYLWGLKLMLFCFFFPKKTITVEDSPWRQQVREPEAPGRGKYDAAWKTMIPFRPKPKWVLSGSWGSVPSRAVILRPSHLDPSKRLHSPVPTLSCHPAQPNTSQETWDTSGQHSQHLHSFSQSVNRTHWHWARLWGVTVSQPDTTLAHYRPHVGENE